MPTFTALIERPSPIKIFAPTSLVISQGWGLMRASNEHILIVRVPRAGGRRGYPSHPLYTARCENTEDHQAHPLL